jgi:hypothetical protein
LGWFGLRGLHPLGILIEGYILSLLSLIDLHYK